MGALATGAPLGIRRHLRRGWGPAHAIDGFHACRMYPFVYVDGRHVPSRAHAWENTIRSAHLTTPRDGRHVFVHHLTGPYLIRFEVRRRRAAPFVLPSNTHSHSRTHSLACLSAHLPPPPRRTPAALCAPSLVAVGAPVHAQRPRFSIIRLVHMVLGAGDAAARLTVNTRPPRAAHE